jgi:hypothetical protein
MLFIRYIKLSWVSSSHSSWVWRCPSACCLHHHPDDGRSKDLWRVVNVLPNYTTQDRRPLSVREASQVRATHFMSCSKVADRHSSLSLWAACVRRLDSPKHVIVPCTTLMTLGMLALKNAASTWSASGYPDHRLPVYPSWHTLRRLLLDSYQTIIHHYPSISLHVL